MKLIKPSIAKWFIMVALILVTFETVTPQRANAGWLTTDVGSISVGTGNWLTSVGNAISTKYMEMKETVLDPLAWMLAKQLLQSITADIVDWINSGFDGSPAFMSNPESFFLDVADQATGAFIAESGPLSSLCSPFSLDIRLSLGLSLAQSRSSRTRYACTLNTIINNVKNIPNGITVNGSSINGFMNGDFSQGGWPAFISMTTEPQNNIYGAYLTAKSELDAKIGSNQAKITADLSMGSGFMSFKKCENVGTGSSNPEDNQNFENDPTISTKVNSDGSVTYQRCHTETPGSVISSSLNKSLGAGNDSLVAADEIDEIISALFGQLLKTVLNQGLLTTSQPASGSGGTQSIMRDLSGDTTGLPVDAIARSASVSIEGSMKSTAEFLAIRQATVDSIVTLKLELGSLESECTGKISALDESVIAGAKVETEKLLADYQKKLDEANYVSTSLVDIQNGLNDPNTDPKTVQDLVRLFNELNSSNMIPTDYSIANTATPEQTTVTAAVDTIRASVSQYQTMCR